MNVYWGYTGISRLSVHPSVCPFVCISVYVQNTSFRQSTGRGIKSHLVTALVFFLSLGHLYLVLLCQ